MIRATAAFASLSNTVSGAALLAAALPGAFFVSMLLGAFFASTGLGALSTVDCSAGGRVGVDWYHDAAMGTAKQIAIKIQRRAGVIQCPLALSLAEATDTPSGRVDNSRWSASPQTVLRRTHMLPPIGCIPSAPS